MFFDQCPLLFTIAYGRNFDLVLAIPIVECVDDLGNLLALVLVLDLKQTGLDLILWNQLYKIYTNLFISIAGTVDLFKSRQCFSSKPYSAVGRTVQLYAYLVAVLIVVGAKSVGLQSTNAITTQIL